MKIKSQTIEEMIKAGASPEEARLAFEFFEMLKPGLRGNENGRIDTIHGDKNPLGLYRIVARYNKGGIK